MGVTVKFRHALLGVGALALAFAAAAAKADPIPPGGTGQNVKVIGFSGLGGHPGGFKIAIKHTANNKWYLYSGQYSIRAGASSTSPIRRSRAM